MKEAKSKWKDLINIWIEWEKLKAKRALNENLGPTGHQFPMHGQLQNLVWSLRKQKFSVQLASEMEMPKWHAILLPNTRQCSLDVTVRQKNTHDRIRIGCQLISWTKRLLKLRTQITIEEGQLELLFNCTSCVHVRLQFAQIGRQFVGNGQCDCVCVQTKSVSHECKETSWWWFTWGHSKMDSSI